MVLGILSVVNGHNDSTSISGRDRLHLIEKGIKSSYFPFSYR